jgi:inward rectifier potassium channel
MHVIDETSPLFGQDQASLAKDQALLMLTLSGTDETTGQVLMARHEYSSAELRWNHSFRDLLQPSDDGILHFDYTDFHASDPIEIGEAPGAVQ